MNKNKNRTIILVVIVIAICGLTAIIARKKSQQIISDFNKINSSLDSSLTKQLDTIVPFNGCWISENYYNSIKKLKSPREAQPLGLFVDIPLNTAKAITIIYNFHEGGAWLNLKNNNGVFELLEVQQVGPDSFFSSIEQISDDRLRIDSVNYVKIDCENDDSDHRILEEILFKGTYKLQDGSLVEFKNTGEIVGLNGFKFYKPLIDYMDAGLNIDQMLLGESKSESKNYGFKFVNDQLEIYELKCLTPSEGTCIEVANSTLLYKLSKIK